MKKRICQSVYVIFFLTVLLISGRTDLPRGETLRENRLVTGMMIENDKTGSQKKLTAERDMDTIRDCWELLDGLEGKRMPDTDGFTVAVFFQTRPLTLILSEKRRKPHTVICPRYLRIWKSIYHIGKRTDMDTEACILKKTAIA